MASGTVGRVAPSGPGRPDLGGVEEYARAVEAAAGHLAARAGDAGLSAAVPTCPRWRVADLLAHLGVVHRWATSHLRGGPEYQVSRTRVQSEVPPSELVGWFEAGAGDLVAALQAAPAELSAMVFLHDAPAPRLFWARRQAHETTVHSVDALAAALGRAPTAEESGIGTALALDGLDELLCGFVTRGRSKLRRQDGATLAVLPSDADRAWVLRLGEQVSTDRVGADDERCRGAGVRFRGTATQLYLGLWNRGTEVSADDPDLLADWHGRQRVRWS